MKDYNKEELVSQIQDVLSYSQEIPAYELAGVWDIVNEWESQKERFIKTFGGLRYVVSENCEFFMDDDIKRLKIEDFSDWLGCEIGFDDPQIGALSELVYELGPDFYTNRMPFDYEVYDSESDSMTTITEGSKIIKAFKHFVSDREMLAYLQSKASEIIQENKISGRLVFSVHPLDFLSMSDNTYKWDTCTNLIDGSYKVGSLSYMLDDATFVCYIEGKDNVKLQPFPSAVPWNSKKWRTLIHTNYYNNIFIRGKEYPFEIPSAISTVSNYLKDVFKIDELTEWVPPTIESKYSKNNFVYNICGHKIPARTLVDTDTHAMNFNDVYFQPTFTRYCYDTNAELILRLNIGANAICPCCGERAITSTEEFICEKCYKYIRSDTYDYPVLTCTCCNEPIYNVREMRRTCKNNIGHFVCIDCYIKETEEE